MYERSYWQDHVVAQTDAADKVLTLQDASNKALRVTVNSSGQLTKAVDANGTSTTLMSTGEVIQQGTAMDQAHFNNLEKGVSDNQTALRLLLLKMLQDARGSADEVHHVTLKNTASYPFNSTMDTPTTVALNITRNSTDYAVIPYVEGHEGEVGAIHVEDQLTNGFKVSFDGSATSVDLVLLVQGGM